MGTKDDKTKEYLTDNARFADIVNFYLFKGKKVVSAADLKEKDTTECLTVYGADDAEITKQKWRDILKSCTIKEYGNTLILIIGIEDQSDIHYAMPVKNMLYDAMNFASQVAEAAKKHRKNKDLTGAEFLSGFSKDDRLTPVITITLYWGADRWDAPRTLHEMIGTPDSPLLQFVNDYDIHLISPYEMSEEDFACFETQLAQVLKALKYSKSPEKLKEILQNDPAFKKLGRDAVSLIETLSKIKLNADAMKEKETIDMWEAIEAIKKEAAAEAAKEAVAEAILNDSEPIKAVKREAAKEAVLSEKRNIARKLMDDLNITEEKAFQLVGIPCAE